jgi:hypothetical protein
MFLAESLGVGNGALGKRRHAGDVELQAEIQRLAAEHEAKEYQRLRYFAYPDHRAQLDLLYHDIKSGNLENGSWVQTIEAIKAQHPKP